MIHMKWLIPLILLIGSGMHLLNEARPLPPAADAYKGRMALFCAPGFDPASLGRGGAPLFRGLGNLHFPVTTASSRAQQYFNQGLTLLYAFNHNEAGRSFLAATELDSTCAMAYWGLAMVLGPNYNAALNPTSLQDINAAIDKAVRHSRQSGPRERLLIRALRSRFPDAAVEDMAPYHAAYAASMKTAHEAFPADMDIAALYADALMNEHPWNLWNKDGSPQPWTDAITSLLEKSMAAAPGHPGLNHMYIHAMEASPHAGRAAEAADRLRDMLPAAGHLVHMPSHIDIRTGAYHKGVLANEKAALADSNYIAQCKVQGTYPLLYYPHNIHFLAACAYLEGNSKKAMEAAWMVSRKADKKYIMENVTVQHYFSIPYYLLVHLGRWKEILELPQPHDRLRYPVAIWHYARGEAFLALGDRRQAARELAALEKIAADPSLQQMLIWESNNAGQLAAIAAGVLSGDLLASEGRYAAAIEGLKAAAVIEDGLNYTEPPDWFFSVRHTLGHVLNKAGRFAEAEKVYEEDLLRLPENGWALMGLYNSLQGQGKKEAAAAVLKRKEKAWQWADIAIRSSRLN